jgi:hypothetical protein
MAEMLRIISKGMCDQLISWKKDIAEKNDKIINLPKALSN